MQSPPAVSPVEIPGHLVEFLADATIAIVGTRGPDLVPNVHRPSAFRLGEDGKSIVCLFPEAFTAGLESALRDNGEVAFTVSQVPSHETYQLKGKWIESGPIDGVDFRLYELCRERAVARISQLLGIEPATLRESVLPPTLRIRFDVREIFDQTPGPGAGRRIVPLEEA
jgi:hypothetical protein